MTSAARSKQFPPDYGAEVVFAGRSNAGKSSAINAITGVGGLARTSKTPGRTQLINFFSIGADYRLVDIPGYGFARVPEPVRRQWRDLIEGYLSTRESLKGMILLVDIRHPMKEFDSQMLVWAGHVGLSVHVLLTKADKLTRNKANQALGGVEKALPDGVGVQLFSALKAQGIKEARSLLDQWLRA